MRAFVVLVLVAAMSGCLGSTLGRIAEKVLDEAVQAIDVSGHGCEETHALLPLPVAAFDGSVPPGFQIVASDAAGLFTDFYLATRECQTASLRVGPADTDLGRFGEMWGFLFVTPPAELDAGSSDVDVFPLGIVVSSEEAASFYGQAGSEAPSGQVQVRTTQTLGPLVASQSTASAAGESFDLRATVRETGGAFRAGSHRIWVVAEGGAIGSILHSWQGGLVVGSGPALLYHEGDPKAGLPLSPGAAQHVRDVSFRTTFELRLGAF